MTYFTESVLGRGLGRGLVLSLVLSWLAPVTVWAHSNGYTGGSGMGATTCASGAGCHTGSTSYSGSVAIYKTGSSIVPDTATAGKSYNYTVVVQGTGMGLGAGFDLAATGGSLSSTQANVKLASGELTHTATQSMVGGQASWDFTWTAPASSGSVTLYVCGNVVNMDGKQKNDQPVCPSATITVSPPVVDTTPPAFAVLSDISVNALSYFTPVTLPAVTATDAVDGTLPASTTSTGPYVTGTTPITWTATDSSNNTGTANQNLLVLPLAGLGADATVMINGTYSLLAQINGSAIAYPLNVPLTKGGDAVDGVDYTLAPSSVTINSGQSIGTVSLSILSGATAGRTLTLTLGSSTEYVNGNHATQTLTIAGGNARPLVALSVDQGGKGGPVVIAGAGQVTVTANAVDPDASGSLTYDWSASDAVPDSAPGNSFSFTPAQAQNSHLVVTVSDGSASTTQDIWVKVLTAANSSLTGADTDGDGIADNVENIYDVDQDGVADYLDFTGLPNVLAIDPAAALHAYIESAPGDALRLGSLAQQYGQGGARVYATDVAAVNASGSLIPTEINTIYDIEVLTPPDTTGGVLLTLPTLDVLFDTNNLYVDGGNGSWHLFIADASNTVTSAAADSELCPALASAYAAPDGTNTQLCLALLVQDGGPNDADGVADGKVTLRMGSSGTYVPPAPPGGSGTGTTTTTEIFGPVTPDSGGGAFNIGLLLTLLAIALGAGARRALTKRNIP